jgi:twitching motility protein PilT
MLHQVLQRALELNASDIFIIAGLPLSFKIDGAIQRENQILSSEDSASMVSALYAAANSRPENRLREKGDDDFSLSVPGLARFRVSAFKQRGTLSAVVRVVPFTLPDPKKINIPDAVLALANRQKGLVLVTGAAGSGKSTTLTCMIDEINKTRNCHIITIEDPIEYLHRHKKSIVTQREIATDTEDYLHALRAALRQSIDVILIGEMRDYNTIATAMTAAETGHLVFSTLHTVGAANTIDRVIDVFPAEQQRQIRTQLAMVLEAVISQQLIPALDGTVVPVFEIMTASNAVRHMIREGKIHQIDSVIHSSPAEGMISMDTSIFALYEANRISKETALSFATNVDLMEKRINMAR